MRLARPADLVVGTLEFENLVVAPDGIRLVRVTPDWKAMAQRPRACRPGQPTSTWEPRYSTAAAVENNAAAVPDAEALFSGWIPTVTGASAPQQPGLAAWKR
jgi:hypothetical protein